jgi:hypothetical protein
MTVTPPRGRSGSGEVKLKGARGRGQGFAGSGRTGGRNPAGHAFDQYSKTKVYAADIKREYIQVSDKKTKFCC